MALADFLLDCILDEDYTLEEALWVLEARIISAEHTTRIPQTQDQMDLHTGIDLDNIQKKVEAGFTPEEKGFFPNSRGERVLVKQSFDAAAYKKKPLSELWPVRGVPHARVLRMLTAMPSAHREASYYSMARDVFKMQDHVPTTSLFSHGGKLYSAMRAIPGAIDGDSATVLSNPNLYRVHKPVAQKLALMDMALGNLDRHSGNHMFSDHPNSECCRNEEGRARKHVNLIDHGFAFMYDRPVRLLNFARHAQPFEPNIVGPNKYLPSDMPDPSTGFHPMQHKAMRDPLHPEVKQWFMSIKPGMFHHHLKRNGIPDEIRQQAMANFHAMRKHISMGGKKLSLAQLSHLSYYDQKQSASLRQRSLQGRRISVPESIRSKSLLLL